MSDRKESESHYLENGNGPKKLRITDERSAISIVCQPGDSLFLAGIMAARWSLVQVKTKLASTTNFSFQNEDVDPTTKTRTFVVVVGESLLSPTSSAHKELESIKNDYLRPAVADKIPIVIVVVGRYEFNVENVYGESIPADAQVTVINLNGGPKFYEDIGRIENEIENVSGIQIYDRDSMDFRFENVMPFLRNPILRYVTYLTRPELIFRRQSLSVPDHRRDQAIAELQELTSLSDLLKSGDDGIRQIESKVCPGNL